MPDLHKLPARTKDGDVHVVVETPRGSAAKMEFDPDLQAFTMSPRRARLLVGGYPRSDQLRQTDQ
jgi:hypothetical protein